MSMTKKIRPVDANNLARRIREYMDDFPNATTRLATCRAILSMLGDEKQTPTLRPVSRKQVEKMRGKFFQAGIDDVAQDTWRCSRCLVQEFGNIQGINFCPSCGAPMTDEAVKLTMKRLEDMT